MLARLLPIVAILVACGSPAPDGAGTGSRRPAPRGERRVHGRVLDHHGRPLVLGHARVVDGLGNTLRQVAIAGDGAFAIALDDIAEPVVKLELTGVDHKRTTLLLVPDEGDIEVTARLGTYAVPERLGTVSVILFFGGRAGHQMPMTRQADGTYVAQIQMPDGKHGYEIDGVTAEGNTVNNTTTAAGYEYDGDGDYQSFVEVSDGKATIVFDPARRPKPGVAPRIELGAPNGPTAALTSMFERADRAEREWRAAVMGSPDRAETARAYSWDQARRDVLSTGKASSHPIAQVMSYALYFTLGELGTPTENDKVVANRLLGAIPPDSPLWGMVPSALAPAVAAAGDGKATTRYVADVVAKHPSTSVVGALLVGLLQRAGRDADKLRPLVAQLRQPRFAGTQFEMFATMFDPDRLLAPGKPLPAFEVGALAPAKGKPSVYSGASFTGELTLIDVWATWCKPCVADLPRLQAIHARYGKGTQRGKRLRILSISIDPTADVVVKFQSDPAHAMPWDQAFLGLDQVATLKQAFDWSGAVPLYVLVGADGKIVAATPELSLETLPRAVDEVLGAERGR